MTVIHHASWGRHWAPPSSHPLVLISGPPAQSQVSWSQLPLLSLPFRWAVSGRKLF